MSPTSTFVLNTLTLKQSLFFFQVKVRACTFCLHKQLFVVEHVEFDMASGILFENTNIFDNIS